MEWRDHVLHGDAGEVLARVKPTGDGRRWCADVAGAPLTFAGARLLTWETADGARAGVLRELRRRRVCARCGFAECACLRQLRAGDPADLYGDLDDDDDDGER